LWAEDITINDYKKRNYKNEDYAVSFTFFGLGLHKYAFERTSNYPQTTSYNSDIMMGFIYSGFGAYFLLRKKNFKNNNTLVINRIPALWHFWGFIVMPLYASRLLTDTYDTQIYKKNDSICLLAAICMGVSSYFSIKRAFTKEPIEQTIRQDNIEINTVLNPGYAGLMLSKRF
jgi:hypothetical protein